MKKDTKYKINIWNFTKPKSLFKEGMKLSWRSKKRQKMFGIKDEHSAWDFIPDSNIVEGIRYFRSKLTPAKDKKGKYERLFHEDFGDGKQVVKKVAESGAYYCLSFTI